MVAFAFAFEIVILLARRLYALCKKHGSLFHSNAALFSPRRFQGGFLPLSTGQTNFLNRRLLLFYHFKPYSVATLSLQMLHLTKLEPKPLRVTAVDSVHQHHQHQ